MGRCKEVCECVAGCLREGTRYHFIHRVKKWGEGRVKGLRVSVHTIERMNRQGSVRVWGGCERDCEYVDDMRTCELYHGSMCELEK